jgi:serine/threonine-protein kinase RsbW
VKVCIPGEAEYIGIARQAVDAVGAQARMDREERMALTIAVGEACNNAVRHTERDGDGRRSPVEISCQILDGAVLIEITNQGDTFTPDPDDAQMPHAMAEHGRGIPLMRMLMDGVEYRRVDGGTVVRLLKRRREAGGDEPLPGPV